MDVKVAFGARAPHPLLLAGSEIPHAVLEPNLTCDLRCRTCYRTPRELVKPLAVVRQEVEALLAKRRLETISILGGEPTLHPDLPAIVRLVKGLGLTCQVVTNGVGLHRDRSGAVLDALIAAGLDRVILHVDRGQRREPSPEAVLDELVASCDRRELLCSIAVTVYPDTVGTLGATLRRYARYRHFDGVLATLARDPWAAARGEPPPADAPTLAGEHRALAAELGIFPSSYLPSSLDLGRAAWLVYFYFHDTQSGACFPLSPRADATIRRLLRWRYGRHVFGAPLAPRAFRAALLEVGALECAGDPRRIPELVRFVRRTRARDLRVHYLVVQSGPEFDPERQAVHLCRGCPDATLRAGALVPTCLADVVSPIAPEPLRYPDLAAAVLAHVNPPGAP